MKSTNQASNAPPPVNPKSFAADFATFLPPYSWNTALDPQVAASKTRLVITAWESVSIFDKKTGTLLWKGRTNDIFHSFFDTSWMRPIKCSDTRLRYDEWQDRFWILCAAGPSAPKNPPRGFYFLGVSKKADPTQGFYTYWFDVVGKWNQYGSDSPYKWGDVSDFPQIATGPDYLLETNKVATDGTGNYRYWRIAWLPTPQIVQLHPPGFTISGHEFDLVAAPSYNGQQNLANAALPNSANSLTPFRDAISPVMTHGGPTLPLM